MTLLDVIVESLEDKKAQDIKVVDFKNTSPICDYFVICDAPSTRQVNAIYHDVEKAILNAGYDILPQKGQSDSKWIVVDAHDVIVHIFQSDERAYYNMEKLYTGYVRD